MGKLTLFSIFVPSCPNSKSIYMGTNFRITIINVHVHSVFVPQMPSWVIVMNNINILLVNQAKGEIVNECPV